MRYYFRTFAFAFITLTIISCGSNPYSKTNKMHREQSKELTKQLNIFPPERSPEEALLPYGEDWVGTTNFSLRKPNFVILHHTAQDSLEQTLSTFTLTRTQVSSHYVIGKNGKIYHMLNDYYRAWHAGAGKWGNNTDLNSTSLGIELDNNGVEPFSPVQIESLLQLLKVLKEKYNIPAANFIGHSDIAPARKVDPNIFFPWKLLAEEGFGLWYDEDIFETAAGIEEQMNSIPVPAEDSAETVDSTQTFILGQEKILDVEPEVALRIIGYDTSNLSAAIQAFKLHFVQGEITPELTERDLMILNNLYRKYL
ncbi:N-acetylmuramoyl-L-alanine amidase [Antarcticibacterium sp. 1MA-6-2]|uniref:N-acetylmuramoyl-L-alanine amidase n=1 Tax=Antarcticibacterium sp. 1MA-6-2 TaxID=2908210 RepID=UPI001F178416|nr:N-acetylmuramoyl-L-alanine amidase [Antarcticibacterium sp. 1MA-6-2]UJH90135.1 N-acetylmuramoyl-L-alanine amidase [Antarcticibacterium sp. 1MA-6-2]